MWLLIILVKINIVCTPDFCHLEAYKIVLEGQNDFKFIQESLLYDSSKFETTVLFLTDFECLKSEMPTMLIFA